MMTWRWLMMPPLLPLLLLLLMHHLLGVAVSPEEQLPSSAWQHQHWLL
jgi:hypothetical protein